VILLICRRRHDDVNSIFRALALSLSAAFLLLGGCSEEQPTALVASAKDYLAKKDSRTAVIQLKSALQKQPNLAEARFLLGRTLLEDGDAVSGEVELRKALDLRYPRDQVLPLLVRALIQQGKAQRAIQDYGAVQLNKPMAAAELKTALAAAYAQQGDTAKAQTALDDALRAAPDFAAALLLQARLKIAVNDVDGALALIDRVVAKDPANYEALQFKGDLLFLVKREPDAALRVQRQAVAARPDWMPARASVMEILLSRRDLAAAKTEVAELKKVLPDHPQTRYFEARLAYLNRDYKAAQELLQPLLTAAPDNVRVLLLAAATEFQAGSLVQAESFAAKALQRAPGATTSRRLLAQIQIRMGEPQKAQATLQPLMERPEVEAETLNLAAQAALQLGDATKAEAYFNRAAKVKPNDARSRTALALVQSAKGNTELAFSQLEEIAASDTSTIADMALVSARMRQGDLDGALKAVDSMERKQPGKPFAAQLRGQIQVARNDAVGARQSFENALSIDPLYYPAAASLAALDLHDKKPDAARKRFDKLLAADPKDIRALLAVTELRAQAGASKEEIAGLLANAIKLNPTLATPRWMLVDLHLRSKDYRAALIVAQEGIAAIPDNHELLDALGRAQLAAGDAAQAVGTFSKLAVMEPRAPEARMRVAEAYLATNNQAAARESLNRALDIAPMFLPAQRALVQLELSAGRPEQAMVVARKVQADRPSQGVGYLLAGDIESSRKKWEAAAAAYRAGLGREPSTELAVKLHSALTQSKKTAESDSFAASWIREHPQDAAFRIYLGDLAVSKLDLARAEAEYLAVLKLQPDNPIALNNLAWVTNSLKKPGATAYAERANALKPGQPAFMDTLATVLADSGQVAKALEIQKQAIALQPDYPQFRLNLAKLYIKAGDKANARIELERLTKLGDKFSGQAEVGELVKTL
jgi:cellulose synthase operon protein C